jgi:hypothetical protein
MVLTCNLSCSGGRGKDLRFEASLGKDSIRLYLKNKIKRAKWHGSSGRVLA